MPVTPCLTCGALSRNGSYCPEHVLGHGWRGSGGKAATFRRRTLKVRGTRCARCGSRDQVEAHHPTRDAKVGVPLCRACHEAEHQS